MPQFFRKPCAQLRARHVQLYFVQLRFLLWAALCWLGAPPLVMAQAAHSPSLAMAVSEKDRPSSPILSPSITIASRCEGDRQIAAQVYADSIVVNESMGGNDSSHVVVLSGNHRKSADSLFVLIKGLGGALILRCPNVEAVSCRFEATLDRNRLECTNCAACSDDLDRMSLATLHRFKALLRDLNLFL